MIPTRTGERLQPTFDKAASRERNRVERVIDRLKPFRRIATRCGKRAANDLATVRLGRIMLRLPTFAETP